MWSRNSSHFTEINALLPFTRAAIGHCITEFNPDHSLSSLNSILILSSQVRLGFTSSLFTSSFTLQFWHVSHILHARYCALAIWYSLIWQGDSPHYVICRVRLFLNFAATNKFWWWTCLWLVKTLVLKSGDDTRTAIPTSVVGWEISHLPFV